MKLDSAEIARLTSQLRPGWEVKEASRRLERSFKFKNFISAMAFANRVGEVAEELGHHPDLQLGWGYVVVATTTHSAGALTSLDFDLARRVDDLGV